MDMEIDRNALVRRPSTRSLTQLMEHALHQAFGFPVQVLGVKLWASPGVLENDTNMFYVSEVEPTAIRSLPTWDPATHVLASDRRKAEEKAARQAAKQARLPEPLLLPVSEEELENAPIIEAEFLDTKNTP